MALVAGRKRKRNLSNNILPTPQPRHPYLSGNFAPIQQTLPLTPCTFVGRIPEELADGEYVRNGSNPVSNEDLGRDAHWFDGDGMLSGVSFAKDSTTGKVQPEFVNQFVLTDLYLSSISSPRLRVPILPSIATLVNPLASFIWVTVRILRTVFLVILSHLPGSKQPIKKISVANTNVVYHDGRALATCESGPPIRIHLPGLETVGWYDGTSAQGEPKKEADDKEAVLGGSNALLSFMREWTTAHPKVDPETKEMLMFHSSFAPPFIQYSIVPQTTPADSDDPKPRPAKLLNAAVPGVSSAKMMHDFGVSSTHTVIMDLPLTLDPINQLKGLPPVSYDSSKPSRFGVFPRREPEKVQWFETDASCIFHTANTWDDVDPQGDATAVNMLACRLTSATLVFATGNIAPPIERRTKPIASIRKRRMPFFSKYDPGTDQTFFDRSSSLEYTSDDSDSDDLKETLIDDNLLSDSDSARSDFNPFDDDQCRLYYYSFSLSGSRSITHQWALTSIPFEFPSVRPDLEMHSASFVYGCSTTTTSFGSALGKATKIDAIVKIDAATLISRGRVRPPPSITGVVDTRNMAEILASNDPRDPVRVFKMPEGWFAQEPRFVPAATNESEDDGHLLFYAFDEAQLDVNGDVPSDIGERKAKSELWIVNARNMRELVGRVQLPQRVPYGLHGTWFSGEEIRRQRPVETIRSTVRALGEKEGGMWMKIRDGVERMLG